MCSKNGIVLNNLKKCKNNQLISKNNLPIVLIVHFKLLTIFQKANDALLIYKIYLLWPGRLTSMNKSFLTFALCCLMSNNSCLDSSSIS